MGSTPTPLGNPHTHSTEYDDEMSQTAIDTFVEAWVCDQPPRNAVYRVLRDEWIEQGNRWIRLIYEIQMTQSTVASKS